MFNYAVFNIINKSYYVLSVIFLRIEATIRTSSEGDIDIINKKMCMNEIENDNNYVYFFIAKTWVCMTSISVLAHKLANTPKAPLDNV